MNAARIWATCSLVIGFVAACSSSTPTVDGEVTAATGESTAALSFPSGDNDGYCASNPSGECGEGTPLPAKTLVLTFDDGPASQTSALSSWLNGQGIHATFFVNGKNFPANPGTLFAQELSDGHLLGNHTQNHIDLTTLSNSDILSEVTETDVVIAPYVASSHFVFRAPYGAWDANDYTVLHGSAMNKYAGPVKWDIGGAMTAKYGADWDCWQNTSGYGVQTTKQCGDRYLQEIADVGRGIVLMHDADYGDVSNHSLTSGEGNTIDMVKYMVPLLKAQGYSFVRIDQVPDIAATFSSGGGVDAGSGGGTGGTCAFDPTWAQTSYANDWWVEYTISGNVTSASLEVVGGATTTLSSNYGKWTGSPPSVIPSGTEVIVHAKDSAGDTAQTQPFAYLTTTNPVTACGTAPSDAGAVVDAGSCSNALDPAWSEGSGANNWWVEYALTPNTAIASVYLEVVGGETVTLSPQYGKWTGGPSARIATGASVIVHAEDTLGNKAQTTPFGYLSVTAPVTQGCSN